MVLINNYIINKIGKNSPIISVYFFYHTNITWYIDY